MIETVLECKNLTKKYITKTALKGIDLSVPKVKQHCLNLLPDF